MPTPEFKILPRFYIEKKISRIYWQSPPPLWRDGDPSPNDIELARELFRELDPFTREWYGRYSVLFRDIYLELKDPDPEWYDKKNK